ncbi:hypothetical protein H2199_008697 [Coniosporium tulheliwenetii]|uniref:Uncharacterized protein n=1 Tax=Coniosporium tulheliwenetii TaxID=3383036 RepID=A0ACC2YJ35_9PEZI|nr:hypothetical protein H2199_008697 [Cladosporium sp. JES 115]
MTSSFKSFLNRLTPNQSSANLSTITAGFAKAEKPTELFPKTDPAVDGEDCLHDCATCTVSYPSKWSIDEEEEVYGHVKGWQTHLLVATGKTDWVRDVADEEGSIMEAIERGPTKPTSGRLMLSASNMPLPSTLHHDPSLAGTTSVLLLPAFTIIENVTPANVPNLITTFVDTAPTNTTPLIHPPAASPDLPRSSSPSPMATPPPTEIEMPELPLTARPCPHDYLILLCSQKTRDARCGQSAPLLRRELERHLRPLGLYRDLHDERPGGVGIYFISHVGGHKFAANVMVYRRARAGRAASRNGFSGRGLEVKNGAVSNGSTRDGKEAEETDMEAAQCIWLARVRPEDCENIVRYTVLQGKVVKPERQLRGGFDRRRGLVSW